MCYLFAIQILWWATEKKLIITVMRLVTEELTSKSRVGILKSMNLHNRILNVHVAMMMINYPYYNLPIGKEVCNSMMDIDCAYDD